MFWCCCFLNDLGLLQVASSTYRENVNTYNVKCGGSLEMWESSGWIVTQDPYGWFQWYCRQELLLLTLHYCVNPNTCMLGPLKG